MRVDVNDSTAFVSTGGRPFDPSGETLLFNLGSLNALRTEGTLFHDPAHAYRHIWIGLHFFKFRLFDRSQRTFVKLADLALVPIEKVETAHLVGTVVCAVARAHAAIVGHRVKSLGIVHGRIYRTNLLARRIFTVLTHHAHERNLYIVRHLGLIVGLR